MKISFALLAFSLAQEEAVATEENVAAVEDRHAVRETTQKEKSFESIYSL